MFGGVPFFYRKNGGGGGILFNYAVWYKVYMALVVDDKYEY